MIPSASDRTYRDARVALIFVLCLSAFAQDPHALPTASSKAESKSSPRPTPEVIEIYPVKGSKILPPSEATASKDSSDPPPVYGSETKSSSPMKGGIEILSDRKGVDFEPYIKRMHILVQNNWYPLIPEVALPPV